MSVVRPEFGPTLPDLLGPRVRALPRAAQVALAAVALVLAAAVLYALLPFGGTEGTRVVVREPVAFNLRYTDGLREVAARAPEAVRLQGDRGQSLTVTPLKVGPYRGDASAWLTVRASRLIDELRASHPGFVLREEGRVNVNRQPGYEMWFQFRRDGRTAYGRRLLLVPGSEVTLTPTEGADVLLLADRSAAIPRYASVGANGPLKTPLRSFRFGTEAP